MTLRWTRVGPTFWAEECGNYYVRLDLVDGTWVYRACHLICDAEVILVGEWGTLADAKRAVARYDAELGEEAA